MTEQLIIETEKKLVEVKEERESIASVVDTYYDLWMSVLVPLLRQKNKSVYKGLVSILHRGGYTHANVGNVGAGFRRARKSREVLK